MTVNFRSSLDGFSFLVDLKMDKYLVEIFCSLPKRRSNLTAKAAIFNTQREKRIYILVTPDRVLTLIISFLVSDAADIVVSISKAVMF
jgi:hypothetical protein